MKFIYAFVFLIFNVSLVAQQVTNVTPIFDRDTLVGDIVGPGVHAFNVQLLCDSYATGRYTPTALPINAGIVLSTGKVSDLTTPNAIPPISTDNGLPGDPDLNTLAAFTTYDGCALEFDFISQCANISIPYFFASEEYPYDPLKAFNDVFGIFIAPDPGVGNPYVYSNISEVVPGTPVGVPTVNQLINAGFYNSNGMNGFPFQGYTDRFVANATVTPCNTYHMKIVIADGGDRIFDSSVFLEAGSITCDGSIYSTQANVVDAIENCQNGSFELCRSGSTASNVNVNYTVLVSSTASSGVDYTALPGNAIIPIGSACVTVPITPMLDIASEGTEFITIEYYPGPCSNKEQVTVNILDQFSVSVSNKSTCSGTPVIIGAANVPGYIYSWAPSPDLSSTNVSTPTANHISGSSTAVSVNYTLSVTNASGCLSTKTITVTYNAAPTVDFTATDVCLGYANVFTNNSVPNSASIDSNIWTFGDGYISFLPDPSHAYSNAGNYNVTLLVVNSDHCHTSLTKTVNVWELPIADFSTANTCQDAAATFTDQSISPVGDPIASWLWNFSDGGSTSVQAAPTHVFSTTGTKSVLLIVATIKGCVGTVTKVVTIYPVPSANFSFTNNCIGVNTEFEDVSSLASGNIIQWNWNFGNLALSTIPDPMFNFPAVMSYDVMLAIQSNQGCRDTMIKSVQIYNRPTADFDGDELVTCEESCVNFTNESFDVTSGLTYVWDFGVGQSSTEENPRYCYGIEGKYTVTLIATNIYGCSDEKTKIDYITILDKPYAAYAADQNESSFDPSLILDDLSLGDIIEWVWDMGDSTVYIHTVSTDFQHLYDVPGVYTTSLVATGSNGCTDTLIKTVKVSPNTRAWIPNAFTPNDNYKNELFYPKLYLGESQDYKMYIFDRWGKQVFYTEVSEPWNGMIQGQDVPAKQDVYAYKIVLLNEFGEEVVYSGYVTLLR